MIFNKMFFISLCFVLNHVVFAQTPQFNVACLPVREKNDGSLVRLKRYAELDSTTQCLLSGPNPEGSLEVLIDPETGQGRIMPLGKFLQRVSRHLALRRLGVKLVSRGLTAFPGLKETPFIDVPFLLIGDLANQSLNSSPLISNRAMISQSVLETFLNVGPNSLLVYSSFLRFCEKVLPPELLVRLDGLGVSLDVEWDTGEIACNKAINFLCLEVLYEVYQEVFRMRHFRKSKNDDFAMMFSISETLFQSLWEKATPRSVDSFLL
jgi:hypothetical protein